MYYSALGLEFCDTRISFAKISEIAESQKAGLLAKIL
jgi:hypothetical protein